MEAVGVGGRQKPKLPERSGSNNAASNRRRRGGESCTIMDRSGITRSITSAHAADIFLSWACLTPLSCSCLSISEFLQHRQNGETQQNVPHHFDSGFRSSPYYHLWSVKHLSASSSNSRGIKRCLPCVDIPLHGSSRISLPPVTWARLHSLSIPVASQPICTGTGFECS